MNQKHKSVVTCDLEGRIQTYNKGAEEIFGFRAEEVIGKKRVYLFQDRFGEAWLERLTYIIFGWVWCHHDYR